MKKTLKPYDTPTTVEVVTTCLEQNLLNGSVTNQVTGFETEGQEVEDYDAQTDFDFTWY